MECYCVTRKKQVKHEKTKLQIAMIILVHGFVVCLRVLILIVIGHYRVNFPENFQVFTVFRG